MTRLMPYTTSLLIFTVSIVVLTASTGPPNHWVLPNPKVYVLRIAVDSKAKPASPYYYAKVRFIGYYENNETKEGAGNITIEYVLQDDGTRTFVESVPTSVDAQRKLTTTWAAIKSK